MTKPVVVIVGFAPWTEVIIQRISRGYRPVVYSEPQQYVARLADDGAAAILVSGEQADWSFWVTTPKSSAATRRIPIILVSADAATRERARTAGADMALAPAELLERLSDILSDVSRVPGAASVAAMTRQCEEPLPPEAVEAVARFNAGEYYQQHDLFEALWVAERGPVRDLYRAILQVGIAYYQVTRGNQRGALKMLLRSVQWLALLPDVCQGVDVAQLRADAAVVRAELERLGPGRMGEFDAALLRPVRLVENAG